MFILLALVLSGCENKEKNFDWYMQHPLVLKEDIGKCMAQAGREKNAAACDIVMRAGVSMTALVNQEQEDPEKFGQRVLDAEEALAVLHEQVVQAEAAVRDMKDAAAQKSLNKAIKAYRDQERQIKIYWAVISLTSPG